MKFLTGAVLSAVLLAAGPAFADRGHGHGPKHHWKHDRHAHHHYYDPPRHVVVHRYAPPPRVVHHYHQPAPVYYRPSAGIHVVLPNLYIPLN